MFLSIFTAFGLGLSQSSFAVHDKTATRVLTKLVKQQAAPILKNLEEFEHDTVECYAVRSSTYSFTVRQAQVNSKLVFFSLEQLQKQP